MDRQNLEETNLREIKNNKVNRCAYLCQIMGFIALYVITALSVIAYFVGNSLPTNNVFALNISLLAIIKNGLSLFLALHTVIHLLCPN